MNEQHMHAFGSDEFENIVLTAGDGSKRPYFPDIAKRKNGELLVVYYWNSCHVPKTAEQDKGVIRMIRSGDNGKSWSEPVTVVDWRHTGLETRDPNLLELHDGTLWLTFFTFSYLGETDYLKNRQTYSMRSSDGGATWSEPVKITGQNVWNARQGTPAVLENGDILIPLYGSHDYSTKLNTWRLSAIRSSDGGLSWGDETEIAISRDDEAYNEAAFLYVGDRTIYCLTREPGIMFKSADSGRTWSKLYSVGRVHRPHFLNIDSTRAFVTWSNPIGVSCGALEPAKNRRVMGKWFDLQQGWEATEAKVIYDPPTTGVFDMGYSSSVLLPDNRILTIYYDTSRSVLAGTFMPLSVWQ
jgi:hypothetical protein